MQLITFLSDFGDYYPGIVKGVILSICPEVKIVDLTHNVKPFYIKQGAFLLYNAVSYFNNAIHLAVVDPGVGGERKPIIIECKDSYFVGPDNGLLAPAAELKGIKAVYEIDTSVCLRYVKEISKTFHARDIFAPAAALLAKGLEAKEIGHKIEDYVKLELFPKVSGDSVVCEAVYIDRFGNIVTNLKAEYLENKKFVQFKGKKIPIVRYYEEVPEKHALAIIGSFNTLEISLREGSASKYFNIEVGDALTFDLK